MKGKVIGKVLCGLFLVGMMSSASVATVMANVKMPVSPMYYTLKCTRCNVGTVIVTTSEKYEHDETFPCKHGKSGNDYYKVYEEIERKDCDTCTYYDEKKTTRHDFWYCAGY